MKKQLAPMLIAGTRNYLQAMMDGGKIKPFTPYGFKEALHCFNDVVRDGEARTLLEDVARWYTGQGWTVEEHPVENGWIITCYL